MSTLTRKMALDIIRVEVAQHGEITLVALRTYLEQRVSMAAFRKAAAQGLRQYNPDPEAL